MSDPTPAARLDVTGLLVPEREAFADLLESLEGSAWELATECPSWSVKGIALHILGDDLSLLSRQRDQAAQGLVLFAEGHPGLSFRQLLDGFNEQWVHAAMFLSESLVVEQLRLTGEWTARYYSGIDAEALGEPVGFFGARGPSPYWQIAAREYVERWVHHHQVRRAVGRPNLDGRFLVVAAAAVARSLAANLGDVGAGPGTSMALTIPGVGAWTLTRGDEGWSLLDGTSGQAAVELTLDPALATTVLSRGLTASEASAAFGVSGDGALARRALAEIARMAGRPDTPDRGDASS